MADGTYSYHWALYGSFPMCVM